MCKDTQVSRAQDVHERRIPDGWIKTKLGAHTLKIGSGITPKGGSNTYKNSGIPLIRSQNVLWGKLSFEDIAYIDNQQHEKMSGSVVVPNDVLLNITGASIGRSCLVSNKIKEANVNQHVCIIRTNSDISPMFLLYFLLSYKGQKQIDQFQAGGNRQGLNFAQIRSFKITLPPVHEQTKIAKILSTWDKAIDVTEKLIENSKAQKKALMQQLLIDHEASTKFKEYKLGNLGSTYTGLSGKTKDDFGKGKPFIPYLNIFINSRVNIKAISLVSISKDEKQYKVVYGDVFFTTSSETPDEVGMSSVLLDEVEELYLNSFCFGFRLDNFDTLSPEFAQYLFRGQNIRRQIFKLAQGATRYNLSKKSLLKITLKLPSIKEQQKIASILFAADKEIKLLQQKYDFLVQEKKALMQQLLTGKRRVKVDAKAN